MQMVGKIHQEIHSELQSEDSHVEFEYTFDPTILGQGVAGWVDDADPELAQYLDTRTTALIDRPLQQRHKNELRQEDRKSRERHPWIEVDRIGEHGKQDACLQQGLGDALSNEAANRLHFDDDHCHGDALRLGRRGG